MPREGRQLLPVASMRITKDVSLDDVRSWVSKKMPPRKGRKNRSMMSALNPSACAGRTGGTGHVSLYPIGHRARASRLRCYLGPWHGAWLCRTIQPCAYPADVCSRLAGSLSDDVAPTWPHAAMNIRTSRKR